jgi:hypothetical protein
MQSDTHVEERACIECHAVIDESVMGVVRPASGLAVGLASRRHFLLATVYVLHWHVPFSSRLYFTTCSHMHGLLNCSFAGNMHCIA